MRKKIFVLFKEIKLKVTIEANITSTEFLDVYFDLKTGEFKPYRKNDNVPLYINARSNHPRSIKMELPRMIGKRVSNLSSSKEVFENESKPYQDALKQAGYTEKLEFLSKSTDKKKRTRSRKVIWFNPPFSESVKTKVGEKFLLLIDKHFGKTELRKYFNRSTVKISYSCMPNLNTLISGHNKNILRKMKPDYDQNTSCNCRGGHKNCPLNGKCLQKGVVYKAEVSSNEMTASYLGIAANSFKERYANHKLSFNNSRYECNTSLSKHIWNLKKKNHPYKISWSIAAQAQPYKPASKSCNLCLLEKTLILLSDDQHCLNKRSELLNKCRHREKYLLCKCYQT